MSYWAEPKPSKGERALTREELAAVRGAGWHRLQFTKGRKDHLVECPESYYLETGRGYRLGSDVKPACGYRSVARGRGAGGDVWVTPIDPAGFRRTFCADCCAKVGLK